MKNSLYKLLALLLIASCTSSKPNFEDQQGLTIAFGSCNNQKLKNNLWKEVIKHRPVVWIWGGDNVYSDTDDMVVLKRDYDSVLNNSDYKKLRKSAKILGTWDDHDYGLNDGGTEFLAKKQSQQAFLDFMGVPKTSKRRQQEGIYHAETIKTKNGTVKVISLDTRYFRTALTKNTDTKKRYQPNKNAEGTMLGAAQWAWLEHELTNSTADFNLINSSVQVLSCEHGYETWGNMPHEVVKLTKMIAQSKAKGVILLSGDRHISDFSKIEVDGLSYPLIDFTSSGLTHAAENNKGEPNRYRAGAFVAKKSFGLLLFDFKKREVTMQMRGENDVVLGELKQGY